MVLDNSLLNKIEDFKHFLASMLPVAGNQAPPADTTSGSRGTDIDYARADHTHPKSTLYAEANHTHPEYSGGQQQDISGKLDISQPSYKGKNVVVDSTTGNITFENKPSVPSAGVSAPPADVSGGTVGSSSSYAKADHQHPLSTAYEQTTNKITSSTGISSTSTDSQYASAKSIYDFVTDVIGDIHTDLMS